MAETQSTVGELTKEHRIDVDKLARWCRANIGGFGEGLQVSKFQGGASNPTFLLETRVNSGDMVRRYVLRKRPEGQLLPSAHKVDREFRVMNALADSGLPVPRMYVLCEDTDVVGTAFYVMDYLDGRIFRDARLPGLQATERSAIYDSLNAVLARLHEIDPDQIGLSDFGKPGNFFERQMALWTRQYEQVRTENNGDMEYLLSVLPGRVPAEATKRIVHGDYRLENVVFAKDSAEIIGILDWELSTTGDPLADLAHGCTLYRSTSERFGTFAGVDLATSGIPTEAEYVAAYCRRTGRDGIADWPFYQAFAAFRLAVISFGVHKRRLDGIDTGPTVESSHEVAVNLAREARLVLDV